MEDSNNCGRLPNGKLLLNGLALTKERLQLGSKVAMPIPALKGILITAIAELPFDKDFYLSAYPDIQTAYDAGQIDDLRAHYIETGYFEGRLGAPPDIDEEFYLRTYPDVAAAISSGMIQSARDHYLLAGAYEGRFGNEQDAKHAAYWMNLFGRS